MIYYMIVIIVWVLELEWENISSNWLVWAVAGVSWLRADAARQALLQVHGVGGAFSVVHQPARGELPLQAAAGSVRHRAVDVRAQRRGRVPAASLLREEEQHGVFIFHSRYRKLHLGAIRFHSRRVDAYRWTGPFCRISFTLKGRRKYFSSRGIESHRYGNYLYYYSSGIELVHYSICWLLNKFIIIDK